VERVQIQIELPSPAAPDEVRAPGDGVSVSAKRDAQPLLPSWRSTAAWALCGVLVLVLSGLSTRATGGQSPWLTGGLLATGLGLLVHALWARPLLQVGRSLKAESERLRSALTCPYCRDGHDDRAVVCDRDGCGAFYHEECWQECRASYGGCAIYGCGCTSTHEVGRFALRKRAWRLLVAAVLFPPQAARRIRELEGQSFREIWDGARRHQAEISADPDRTARYGLLNLVLSAAVVLPGALWATLTPGPYLDEVRLSLIFGATLLAMFAVPILFMRLPLWQAFLGGSAKLLGQAFRDELAALGRADEGTFLARLATAVGKKG
jgi:hypothetical protein